MSCSEYLESPTLFESGVNLKNRGYKRINDPRNNCSEPDCRKGYIIIDGDRGHVCPACFWTEDRLVNRAEQQAINGGMVWDCPDTMR